MKPGQSTSPLLSSWALGSIVRELCERANVPFDAIDASMLEGMVPGFYVTGGSSSASAAIEALAGVYQFDSSNYDGALHFIPRGASSIADITDDDLVDDGNAIEMQTRADPINIPRVMQLKYYDIDGGLTPNQQVSDRSDDYRATSESQSQTTVIMSADDAVSAITIQHKVEIEEQRGEREFSLPLNWLHLTVADVIRFRGERMRITSVDIDDCIQKYRCAFDRLSAYDSLANSVPVLEPDPPDVAPSDTVLHVIDCHILQDSHDQLCLYIACAGTTQVWQGASVQYSRDGGVNWISGGAVRSSATMGQIISELPVGSVAYPDKRNYVDVELLRADMTLTPATLTEMMNRSNLCIIGDELVNFGGAEQLTETTWRLSYFLRGRKGSECVAHSIGERFVLMNPGMVRFTPVDAFNIGANLTFRATSIGAETTEETQTVTYIGRSQIERAPSYFRARRYSDVGASQRVAISWIGVGRLGGGSQARQGNLFFDYRIKTENVFVRYPESTIIHTGYVAGAVYEAAQTNRITGAGATAEATT